MIIVNKNTERKHHNKFLFSKIIKLKIPKPNKYKHPQLSPSLNPQLGKRDLSIIHKMAIHKMVQNFQCPVQHKSKDKELRYSKLLKTTRQSFQRSNTRNENGMRPIEIKKLKNNYTTKTIGQDQKDQRENCQAETKRFQSLQHIINSDYCSARFFSKSLERQNAIVKKDSASTVYRPAATIADDFSLKILPLIKRVLTFERTRDGRKFKNTHYSFRKQQIMCPEFSRAESKIEIRGWQRQNSFLEDEEKDYSLQAKY